MFFTEIPAVPLGLFLNDTIGLFSDALQVVIAQPFLGFLAGLALLLAVFAFSSFLLRQTKGGK